MRLASIHPIWQSILSGRHCIRVVLHTGASRVRSSLLHSNPCSLFATIPLGSLLLHTKWLRKAALPWKRPCRSSTQPCHLERQWHRYMHTLFANSEGYDQGATKVKTKTYCNIRPKVKPGTRAGQKSCCWRIREGCG